MHPLSALRPERERAPRRGARCASARERLFWATTRVAPTETTIAQVERLVNWRVDSLPDLIAPARRGRMGARSCHNGSQVDPAGRDDPLLAQTLKDGLERDGFSVT